MVNIFSLLSGICFCFLVACNTTSTPADEMTSSSLAKQTSITDNQTTKMATPPEIKMDSLIETTHLMGKFDPLKDSDFIEIDIQYADRPGQLLHKETYAAFIQMYEAAKKDDIKLIIKSTRGKYQRRQKNPKPKTTRP